MKVNEYAGYKIWVDEGQVLVKEPDGNIAGYDTVTDFIENCFKKKVPAVTIAGIIKPLRVFCRAVKEGASENIENKEAIHFSYMVWNSQSHGPMLVRDMSTKHILNAQLSLRKRYPKTPSEALWIKIFNNELERRGL